ncbi:MAG: hypothetical protein ACXVPN_07995 [Bacteroidia bacterium]
MKKFSQIIFVTALFLAHSTFAQGDCPPEGSASSARIAALNKLKNRTTHPTHPDFDANVTLKKLLEAGDDTKRWSPRKAGKITGYVYDVKPGGVETCNCKTKEIDKRDTHIEVVIDPMHNNKTKRFVVEVTPHIRNEMKKKGEDWSTPELRKKLLGRWVEFEGWMFFDEEHSNQSENTNPGRARNWRATAWEIHPVTSFKVVTKPK